MTVAPSEMHGVIKLLVDLDVELQSLGEGVGIVAEIVRTVRVAALVGHRKEVQYLLTDRILHPYGDNIGSWKRCPLSGIRVNTAGIIDFVQD